VFALSTWPGALGGSKEWKTWTGLGMTSAGSASRGGSLPPFLAKLKVISETIEKDIAGWAEDGKSFVVYDPDRFETALAQHFKGNLQTFVRQLHFYGFRKVDTRAGKWSFTHPSFQRGKPHLLQGIRRKARSDPAVQATQMEVAQLRNQVAELQDLVEGLRSQLDSVLNVLDDAGVAQVQEKDGRVEVVKASKKRARLEQLSMSIDELDPTDSLSDAWDEDFERNLMELADFHEPNETCTLEFSAEPVPVSIDELKKLEDDIDMRTTSELVAKATDLNPKSVSKVLAYLKDAIKTHGDSAEELAYPHIQRAVRSKFKPSFATDVSSMRAQEVGAN